jgi:uncharacterized membrane protein YbhN (UPF0104 family)
VTDASAPREGLTAAEPGDSAAVPRRRRLGVRQVLGPLASIALIALVFGRFLPEFTSIGAVWDHIRSMTWLEVGTLALAAMWNLITYWILMVATMPGLTYAQAAVVAQSSTAVSNTVPAGSALGIAMSYSMYSSWGFSRSRSSVSLLITGLWNNFAKLGMPVLALTLLAFSGGASGGRVVAGLLGVAALIGAMVALRLLLRSEESAARMGLRAARIASSLRGLLGRSPVSGWHLATTKFRGRVILLLTARWHSITAATVVSHLSLFAVLLLALRHLGVAERDVSTVEALAVFAFARLLTAIPITPGGLGVVELALITGLSSAGGDRAEVAAAVLIFRALTFVLPIPLGVAAYAFWRRNTSWRRPPGGAPRTDLVPEST